MAQEHLGLPFVRGVIKNLVIDLFKRPEPWVRADLVKEAVKKHLELGGILGNQDPTRVIKSTLKILKDENRIKAVALGIWKRIDLDSPEAQQKEEVIPSPEIIQEIQEIEEDDSPVSQQIKEIGSGSEAVYLYFNPNDKELAMLKNKDVWECKVGMTQTLPVEARIFSQGVKTALSKMPEIALVIKTNNAPLLERAIHTALRQLDLVAPDSLGTEWFITNPEKIESWYQMYFKNLQTLK
jgi:hypothetical protein